MSATNAKSAPRVDAEDIKEAEEKTGVKNLENIVTPTEKPKKTPRQTSREGTASCCSLFFFHFVHPVIRLGFRRELDHEDLGPLIQRIQTRQVHSRFADNMAKNKKKYGRVRLLKSLFQTWGYRYLIVSLIGVFAFCGSGPIHLQSRLPEFLLPWKQDRNWLLLSF